MEIRQTRPEDMGALMALFESARAFMKAHGNPNQWGDTYPPEALIRSDIQRGGSYVCCEEGQILGTFYFAPGPDPTYGEIWGGSWLSDAPYWVVHRVATGGSRRGVATFCLEWCLSRQGHIRVDTHRDNFPMQKTLLKNGFSQRGIIHLANGAERIAFEQVKK